jgi:hypothetical protein
LLDQPWRFDLPIGLPLLAGDKLQVIRENEVGVAPVAHRQRRLMGLDLNELPRWRIIAPNERQGFRYVAFVAPFASVKAIRAA